MRAVRMTYQQHFYNIFFNTIYHIISYYVILYCIIVYIYRFLSFNSPAYIYIYLFIFISQPILESHACQSKWMPILQTFFDDSCKYQHFASYPQKSEFQIRHPYKGAESTGCLVFSTPKIKLNLKPPTLTAQVQRSSSRAHGCGKWPYPSNDNRITMTSKSN